MNIPVMPNHLSDVGDASSRNEKLPLRRGGRKPGRDPQTLQKVVDYLAAHEGPVRFQEMMDDGLNPHSIRELTDLGVILSPFYGIYCLPREYDPLLFTLASMRAHGSEFLVCFNTAARFHGIESSDCQEIWVASPPSRRYPRNTGGYRIVPISWRAMQPPQDPLDTGTDLSGGRWSDATSDLELAEQYCGIYRHIVYGQEILVTSPARTVCDLLYFRNRVVRANSSEAASFSDDVAFGALRNYLGDHDVAEARLMAERLGYADDILPLLGLAQRLTL
jgi:hypothetical protein